MASNNQMSTWEALGWGWLAFMGWVFITVVVGWVEMTAVTWRFHHWHGPPTSGSTWMHAAVTLLLLGLILPAVTAFIAIVYYEEAYVPWRNYITTKRQSREVVREEKHKVESQRKLRDLALTAAENDVYDSIKEGRKVSDTTAALLRQAELSG